MLKKKVWIWVGSIVGVVVIVAAVAFFINGAKANMAGGDEMMEDMPVTVQKASEQELTESILVTGQIVPEGEQKVYLEPERGEISEYKVEENQMVKAGDTLFVYDSSKQKVEFNRAVRERDLIQSRAKTEKNQIAEMNKQIANTKKKVGKTQKVANPEDPESMIEIESSVTQEDVNQLEQEKIQLEIQYESTKAEIESAQEQINEIDAQIKEMTVVSKMDGMIVKINKDVVNNESGVSDPVIHIISSEPYKVIGTMSEFDAVKIQKDQAVVIRPKVYKEREWKGVVESISHFPTEDGGGEDYGMGGGGTVTMYPFKVAITDDTSELRQGFHVSLEVKVSGDGKSLVVPHMAIMDEEGVEIIYVLVDGVLERREIQTGKMNDEFVEITEGVSAGELVVTMPDEGMHDGMEVTSFDEVE